jgi:hypothetical protein
MILTALALAASQAAVATPVPPVEIEIARDAMTDRPSARLTLRGDGERIVVSCEAPGWGDLRVGYHSRRWLARGNILSGARPITYRFGAEAPRRRLWQVEDRTATLSRRSRVVAFLQGLMRSDRLVIRTRDVENRQFDSVFPIPETRPAIEQLLATCGSARLNPRLLGTP